MISRNTLAAYERLLGLSRYETFCDLDTGRISSLSYRVTGSTVLLTVDQHDGVQVNWPAKGTRSVRESAEFALHLSGISRIAELLEDDLKSDVIAELLKPTT